MQSPHALALFIKVIHAGDLSAIRSMVGVSAALLSATDLRCFGSTPLIHAVGTDNRATVDLLLDLGADINQRSDWAMGSFGVLDSASDELAEHLLKRGATLTPHAAARLGKLDALRAMLAADPALVHARGGDGQTPLHFARTIPIADLLLQHHAAIDALDLDHASTPAQWLGGTRPEVVSHLVAKGAQPDPFMAVRIGDLSLLERLVAQEPEGVRVRVTRERFPAAPPAAGHIYLYQIGEGVGLMHAAVGVGGAVGAGQVAVIRHLAKLGADVNARGGYDDQTPLHAAAWADKPHAAATLIDCGADINAKSGPMHNNQPVGWAIVSGAVGALRVLLDRGAKLHPHHLEDARSGVQGAFKQFNPRRPIEAWREIEKLLTSRPR